MKKTYIISYDLHKDRDYDSIHNAIKSYKTYANVLKSLWVIKSDQKATEVRDYLSQHIDGDDSLFVDEIARNAAWRNLHPDVTDWLKNNL